MQLSRSLPPVDGDKRPDRSCARTPSSREDEKGLGDRGFGNFAMADGRELAVPATSAAAGEAAQPHNDAALVDFLSSLNDYTPTVLSQSLSLFPFPKFNQAEKLSNRNSK